MARYQDSPYGRYLQQRDRDNRAGFMKGVVLPVAAFATGGAAMGALGPGSAAASVPGAVGSASAPLGTGAVVGSAGGGMTFGNLLRLGELGAGLVTQGMANRSTNRQLSSDAAMRSREFDQQMALLQSQDAEDRRRHDAAQAFQEMQWKASEEDRLRKIRLEDEREARRAPYRAMSQQAMLRLSDLLRLARG